MNPIIKAFDAAKAVACRKPDTLFYAASALVSGAFALREPVIGAAVFFIAASLRECYRDLALVQDSARASMGGDDTRTDALQKAAAAGFVTKLAAVGGSLAMAYDSSSIGLTCGLISGLWLMRSHAALVKTGVDYRDVYPLYKEMWNHSSDKDGGGPKHPQKTPAVTAITLAA